MKQLVNPRRFLGRIVASICIALFLAAAPAPASAATDRPGHSRNEQRRNNQGGRHNNQGANRSRGNHESRGKSENRRHNASSPSARPANNRKDNHQGKPQGQPQGKPQGNTPGFRPGAAGGNNRPQGGNNRPQGPAANHKPNNNHNPGHNNNNHNPGPAHRPAPAPSARPGHGFAHTPPPARPYRPVRFFNFRRPEPPRHWRPGPRPLFSTVLGLTFGSSINIAFNTLANAGYTVDGYADNMIYVNDAVQLNLVWPFGVLRYNSAGLLEGSEFSFSSGWRDTSRYNEAYSRLCALYGPPVQSAGMTASWYGPGGQYVTLRFDLENAYSGPQRYFTTLTFGI